MISTKKIGIVTFLFLSGTLQANNDSIKIQKRSIIQGAYISAGFFYKSFNNGQQFYSGTIDKIPLFIDLYSSLKWSSRIDFLNNVAIDIEYSYTNYIHNDYSEINNTLWNEKGDRLFSIGTNVFLPCYKKKRKGGLFVDLGTSYSKYKGYYSTYKIPDKTNIVEENVSMHYKLFELRAGIGAEYKFKYFQCFSQVNFGWGLGKFNEEELAAKTREFVIGIRVKIPKLFEWHKKSYALF